MAKKQSFEQSLERLADIVEALEREDTSLADAMKLYEEGIALSTHCRTELETAEVKITELRATQTGELIEEEIDLE